MHKQAGLLCLTILCIFTYSSQAYALRENGIDNNRSLKQIQQNSFQPIYQIPLRIHLEKSRRAAEEFRQILEEINFIWLSQAGICFQIETVNHSELIDNGLDLWFSFSLPVYNGYYADDNDIHVLDTPKLNPALNPAQHPAARTAAHELGHSLNLRHNQTSDDNLMRSKTFGWQLSQEEVYRARTAAQEKVFTQEKKMPCLPPIIHKE